ncbi:MAG: Na(+)-translocating NADH-quinone reductase subunit A [Desulfoprunum sp.]|nr:Na(+)-translocating NADH-quinone reductase subunit A [Desulfoprunum sp.]
MKRIQIKKGLDIPISGEPEQRVRPGATVTQVALLGDDSIGMKPTLAVQAGDTVKTGQQLFSDKNTPGVHFTSPGCGTVLAIHRGEKHRFESIIIALEGDAAIPFLDNPGENPQKLAADKIRSVLQKSGLWCSLRTRPYGKIPAISTPASLFITAIDTEPLSMDPEVVIARDKGDFQLGLQALRRLVDCPMHLCSAKKLDGLPEMPEVYSWAFSGPHPAGLPSTHIHFIDPVGEKKTVWQIGYQDVIAIGHLFRTGSLKTERLVSLAGPGVRHPGLLTTRLGAFVPEICAGEIDDDRPCRLISGSVLSGRQADGLTGFLGRYHNQISVVHEDSGRSLFNWLMPGRDRFSIKPLFLSALVRTRKLPMPTALWGGRRAIFPLGTYEQVMPLDIIATSLLKSIAVQDTEKSRDLGCLELIEEDLALCSFVCPGKNDFSPMLRQLLTTLELEG